MSKAVLLMAYGSPTSIDEIEAYYTHIRGGKRPSDEELNDLKRRYLAIGGGSPLKIISEAQRAKLESKLASEDLDYKVYLAMRHSKPFIEDVIMEAYKDGIRNLLCIVLAPHYSKMSVGGYFDRVNKIISQLEGMKVEFVSSWGNHPLFIRLWSKNILETLYGVGKDAWVIFSAHSLPERLIYEGDPYKEQILESCMLIAKEAKIEKWSQAFQSAGHTKEKWMGPDIIEHLDSLHEKGERKFLIAPIGFVADNLEILYDIDIECREWANRKSAQLVRCKLPNDDPLLIECLYSIIKEKLL